MLELTGKKNSIGKFGVARLFIIILITAFLYGCVGNERGLELHPLVSDGMVLQQNSHTNIWGWSNPGAIVKVKTGWGASSKVRVNADSTWKITLATPSHGGPYTISVKSGKTNIQVKDVLIGEVWLCSGQSNMEMPVKGWLDVGDSILNSEEEIANANFPKIRMFTVKKSLAFTKQTRCSGHWAVCTPDNVGEFSATAYFFGRKLYKELGVPVGLIHSSWSGSPAEGWTEAKMLEDVVGFKDIQSRLKASEEAYDSYQYILDNKESTQLDNLPENSPYANITYSDTIVLQGGLDMERLKEIPVPSVWENNVLPGFNGVVWVFTNFNRPKDVYPEGFKLHLGPIDDYDVCYLNGVKIGATLENGKWNTPRIYDIPQKLLKDSNNLLAVKVIDPRRSGGIFGTETPAIYKGANIVSELNGIWKYWPGAIILKNKLYPLDLDDPLINLVAEIEFDLSHKTPSLLYNAMINPLLPYTIKGVVWYQGESNVGRADQYKELFPAMINNWRLAWGNGDFPFYYVQIAPWHYSNSRGKAPFLREVQRQCLNKPHLGMAVTMDVGNYKRIHPKYKQVVGQRLALWALARNYGFNDLVYSGPLPNKVHFTDDVVAVEFEHVGSGLMFTSDTTFFEVAGSNGIFYPAPAIIEGNTIKIKSDSVLQARSVRYAWRNFVEPNLFNKEGLPASPFMETK